MRRRHSITSLLLVACALTACGGKSSERDNGHASESGAGGTAPGTGGTGAPSGGGTRGDTGGTATDTGGTATDTGGTAGDTAGSTGVTGGSAGTTSPPSCDKVLCEPIPTSCKKLEQDPKECCPVCLDTGCEPCAAVDCPDGSHAETLPGDCCPTCVTDPPDACQVGRKVYQELREQLLDKYGSTGCQNSSDCTIVAEDNACAFVCNVPLPSSTAHNFVDNLQSTADQSCTTCEAPDPSTPCMRRAPACVNGKCLAVDLGGN